MKTKNMYILTVVCVALAVTFSSVVAQNRVGTAAASELLIPVGARDMGIGGSGVASTRGVDALFWNPAGVGRMTTSAEAMFSTMSYIADIGVNYGAVAAKFGEFGVLGISLKSLDFGSIPLTTEDDPENSSGRFYSPAFFNLGITYSRALTDAIAVGGTVRIISEQIDRVSASGFALDVGVQYSRLVGVQGLNLGIAVKNIGPQMKFDGPGLLRNALVSGGSRPEQRYKSDAASFELPSLVEVGLAYDSKMGDNMGLMFTGSFINNNLFYDEYRFGGELMLGMESVTLFARMGGSAIPEAEKDLKENIFGISFGAGLNYKAPGIEMTVDYAYRAVELFKANNVLTLKFGF